MRYYGHNATIEFFATEEEARAGRAKEEPRMRCQLARILAGEHVAEEYHGWYIWVEVGAPTMRSAAHYDTHIPVAPCLQYDSPYRHCGRSMVCPAGCVEMLPVFADVPERPFAEWVQAGGEPPPRDIA